MEKPSQLNKELVMYFDKEVAEDFAEREQNEKNFQVAEAIDNLLVEVLKRRKRPWQVAELGGGAHPDRYHKFFQELLKEPKGEIDWVDVSPYMLELAKKYISKDKYQDRLEVLNFIQKNILAYLKEEMDDSIDLAIMKYTIDHIKEIEQLFKLLAKKLKKGEFLVATYNDIKNGLPSYSTNAQFLINGKEIPIGENQKLVDGDTYTVKFFNRSVEKGSLKDFSGIGYLSGAETTKYFYSPETMQKLAKENNLKCFIGDWKEYLNLENNAGIEQTVLVLEKI